MSKHLTILPATEVHRPIIVSLLESVKLPVVDLPSDLSHFLLAIDRSNTIGIVGLEIYGNYGLLRSLVVDPYYRNEGVAGQLIQRLEEYTKRLKLETIYLLTETAAAYFQKKGFQTIQRDQVPAAL